MFAENILVQLDDTDTLLYRCCAP